jgi:SAM-dependent methyltransferase
VAVHGHGGSQQWDELYGSEQVWSGRPNGTLVVEVAGLEPGTALDVGSGEGGDVVELARRGWRVTGLDVSGVALQRARDAAEAAGVEATWVHAALTDAVLPPGGFDLVTVHYPALPKDPPGAVPALLAAVAPGGTLLVVHHADLHEGAHEHGFDPDDYVGHDDLADALGDGWTVEVRERRPRADAPTTGRGAGHVDDLVLRARRDR